MLKKVNCPSCGANLKPDAYYCDYCGAFFENKKNVLEAQQLKCFEKNAEDKKTIVPQNIEETEENLYGEDNFVSTEEIENSKLNNILQSYNDIDAGGKAFAFFMIFVVFSIMFSGAVMDAPFFAIILIMIISGALNKGKQKKAELIALYDKGAYFEAYNKLNAMSKEDKSIKIVKQKILLCYYRLEKKEEAKSLISYLNKQSSFKDEHIKDVANKLGVMYEPKSNFNS